MKIGAGLGSPPAIVVSHARAKAWGSICGGSETPAASRYLTALLHLLCYGHQAKQEREATRRQRLCGLRWSLPSRTDFRAKQNGYENHILLLNAANVINQNKNVEPKISNL